MCFIKEVAFTKSTFKLVIFELFTGPSSICHFKLPIPQVASLEEEIDKSLVICTGLELL